MLESIFSKLLILSVQAGFLILATILIRGICKKIPKKYICLLWCMAALRLLLPVSFESSISLVPTQNTIQNVFTEERNRMPEDSVSDMQELVMANNTAQEIAAESAREAGDTVNIIVAGNDTNKDITYVSGSGVTGKLPDLRMLVIYLWLFGTAMLLGYGVFTYIRVYAKVQDAVHLEENVWLSDRIDTPFLLGYIKPRIYMPFFVDESRREYIIAHENGHVSRGDHITKLIGYLLLSVYWFQPLVWVAYTLFCKDVEMACDEKIIGKLGEEKKKAYSQTLLLCSVEKHYLLANPLAFGEIDVKKRIRNVLSYKKPGVVVSIISIAVILLAAVFFLTTGEEKNSGSTTLTFYQQKHLNNQSDGTRYAVLPLEGAAEPLLLIAAEGTYTDSLYEDKHLSFVAECCMFEKEWLTIGTGTAYPICYDGESLYIASGTSIRTVTVSEKESPETGSYYAIETVYEENDKDYEKINKRYEKADVVDFDGLVEKHDNQWLAEKEEQLRQLQAALKAEMQEEIDEERKALLEAEEEKIQHEINAVELEVHKMVKEAIREYVSMERLFSSSLVKSYKGDGSERYVEVQYEEFPTAQSVYDYMRARATKEWADYLYSKCFDGENPKLKEMDGKLYTTFFDGPWIDIEHKGVTEHVLASSMTERTLIYANEQEDMADYFVRLVNENGNWLVAEFRVIMPQGSHEVYPDTVYTTVDMGDYQVVLQDYTTTEGGPLELAILQDGEKKTIDIFHETWHRDPSKVKIKDVGNVLGYDAFYIYDASLFHTVTTEYYTMIDGTLTLIADSFGTDPEADSFIRDLDGDGINELICNLFYSGDGGEGVYIYKAEDGKILLNDRDWSKVEEFRESENDMFVRYDAESEKLMLSEGENSYYWKIDLSKLNFHEYDPYGILN